MMHHHQGHSYNDGQSRAHQPARSTGSHLRAASGVALKQTTERIVLSDISQMTQMERWVFGEPFCGAIQPEMEKDYGRNDPVEHYSKWMVGSLEKNSLKQNHRIYWILLRCQDLVLAIVAN